MRKTNKFLISFLGLVLITRCGGFPSKVQFKDVKVATFNLSFDRKTFENLVAEMKIEPAEQNELVKARMAFVSISKESRILS